MELMEVSSTAYFISFFISSFFILVFIQVQKVGKKYDNKGDKISKTGKEIPNLSYVKLFGFIRMPAIIDMLAMLYQFSRDGTKFVEKFATELQNAGNFTTKLRVMGTDIIVVGDSALIQNILGSNDPRLLNKPRVIYDRFLKGPLENSMISSEYHIWRPHRKIASRCFTFKALQSYMKLLNKEGNAFAADLINGKETINMNDIQSLVYFYVAKISLEIVVGENCLEAEEINLFNHHLSKGREILASRVYNPLNFISPIWRMNPQRRQVFEHDKAMHSFIHKAIQGQKKKKVQAEPELKKSETQIEDDDVEVGTLSVIEELFKNNLSDEEIYSEVTMFLEAAADPTTTATMFFLQHMAEHVEIQQRLQEEVDAVFDSKESNGDLSWNDLVELKYLERCILETLRITAAVPGTFRYLSDDMWIGEYFFKKGTIFAFPIWLVHRYPGYYENPKMFDPDRFLSENMKERSPSMFLAFNLGPRNCIGYKLAMMMMKQFFARILHQFDVYTNDRYEDMAYFLEFVTTKPERQFNVTLRKRHTNTSS